jgi:hypothetical protein
VKAGSGPSSPTGARATQINGKAKDKRDGLEKAIDHADPWTFERGLRLITALALAGRPFPAGHLAVSVSSLTTRAGSEHFST